MCHCKSSKPANLYVLVSEDPNLSTLKSLIDLAGLKTTVEGLKDTTLFAPNNEAFAELPADLVAYLTSPAGKDDLIDVLTYHLTKGRQFTEDLENGEKLKMFNKQKTTVIKKKHNVRIRDTTCKCAEIYSKNNKTKNCSLAQKIDKVLIPKLDLPL